MDLAAIKAAAQATADQSAIVLPMDDNTELHIDGDYAAYYYSGNDDTEFSAAKRNALDAFRNVRTLAGAGGRAVIHLTSGASDKGQRYDIATVKPYQGQRDSGRKPKNWENMRSWLETGPLRASGFSRMIWADREADDGVASAARYAWQSGKLPAIFTRDKDFRMIPGRHIAWTTYDRVETKPDTWELVADEKVYGAKFFWLQMLMGDTADNIPGLEGVRAKAEGKFKACGESCATERLAGLNPEQTYMAVRALYQSYYGQAWADRFAEQAALLWMRTDNAASATDWLKAIPARDNALEQAAQKLLRRIK